MSWAVTWRVNRSRRARLASGSGLGDGAGEFNGWFCPCHGSHYDTAGRIRKGPAPQNLHIPVAEFTEETTIKLG